MVPSVRSASGAIPTRCRGPCPWGSSTYCSCSSQMQPVRCHRDQDSFAHVCGKNRNGIAPSRQISSADILQQYYNVDIFHSSLTERTLRVGVYTTETYCTYEYLVYIYARSYIPSDDDTAAVRAVNTFNTIPQVHLTTSYGAQPIVGRSWRPTRNVPWLWFNSRFS